MITIEKSDQKQHRYFITTGEYTPPDENGFGEVINRDRFKGGQGYVFKDDVAFYDTKNPDKVCYVPELSDETYTRKDFLELCDNNEELAELLYESLDWQHPETLLEDWEINGEIDTCDICGRIFLCYEKTSCPNCGAVYKGEEDC